MNAYFGESVLVKQSLVNLLKRLNVVIYDASILKNIDEDVDTLKMFENFENEHKVEAKKTGILIKSVIDISANMKVKEFKEARQSGISIEQQFNTEKKLLKLKRNRVFKINNGDGTRKIKILNNISNKFITKKVTKDEFDVYWENEIDQSFLSELDTDVEITLK